ncbi:MAG: hypothetical protein ABI579_01500 [Candidatus Sumerlaeota bacterium]
MANAPLDRPLFTQAFIIFASILCGFGMWLMTQLREKKEISLDVMVLPHAPPEVKLTLHPDRVRVKFSYPSIDEAKMKSDNFYVDVDFMDLTQRIGRRLEDKGDRAISREQVHDKIDAGRYNITTVDLLVPQVSWEASLRHTRAKIEPVITGKPADGFVYNAKSASDEKGPDITVILTEAKEKELMDAGVPLVIKTEPIDVTGQSGLVRKTSELHMPPEVSLLPEEQDQKTRTVFVNIEEEQMTRTLEKVPVTYQFISAAQGLRAEITPPTVNVIITGRTSVVKNITPGMISFGLFGVVERPGETREVAIDPLISETALRQENLQIESAPKSVIVKVVEEKNETPVPAAATPAQEPPPTPAATATETPAPAATATQ